jgi:hypothetical protein
VDKRSSAAEAAIFQHISGTTEVVPFPPPCLAHPHSSTQRVLTALPSASERPLLFTLPGLQLRPDRTLGRAILWNDSSTLAEPVRFSAPEEGSTGEAARPGEEAQEIADWI